jgi:hypothetical protein
VMPFVTEQPSELEELLEALLKRGSEIERLLDTLAGLIEAGQVGPFCCSYLSWKEFLIRLAQQPINRPSLTCRPSQTDIF